MNDRNKHRSVTEDWPAWKRNYRLTENSPAVDTPDKVSKQGEVRFKRVRVNYKKDEGF